VPGATMRIVVTGATGNLGTALLRRLRADHHELVGVVRRPPPGRGDSAIRWEPADLATDDCLPTLERAFAGADAVVHLVWGFQPTHRPGHLEAVGVGGTTRVLAAARAAGVPHLVHTSSVGAYSAAADDRPVDESWPTQGIPTSAYSRHKAAAERLLDAHEATGHGPSVARIRPGIIGQRGAASALLRYTVPGVVPAALLGHVPLLPLDRGLRIPVVHAEDVAEAVSRILEQRATGPVNLAAPAPATAADIADALGARLVHVPSRFLRPVVDLSWRLHLQQVDAGWLDLAFTVPTLDCTRARVELGWAPTHDARSVLTEVVTGMRDGAASATPVLRPRTVAASLARAVRHGAVGSRRRP
jgi:UDP-glucose 4-epimerase